MKDFTRRMSEKELIEACRKEKLSDSDWWDIVMCQELSEEFYKEFNKKTRGVVRAVEQPLSIALVHEFQGEVDWEWISKYNHLSETFMERFEDKLNWKSISTYQRLSERFMRKYKDRLDWDEISACQRLSEQFIAENSDRVNWGNILKYQTLHDEFRRAAMGGCVCGKASGF